MESDGPDPTPELTETIRQAVEDRWRTVIELDAALADEIVEAFSSLFESRGWTPPGESEWLHLDLCDIELRCDGSDPEWSECDFDNNDAHAFHLIETVVREGAAGIRVRRKP